MTHTHTHIELKARVVQERASAYYEHSITYTFKECFPGEKEVYAISMQETIAKLYAIARELIGARE